MIEIELPDKLEARLAAIAEKRGRTTSYYARKALIAFLEDMEDVKLCLEIEIPRGIEDRLLALIEQEGHTKEYYVRKALIAFMEDVDDTRTALQALKTFGRTWTTEELKVELGLEN